MRGHLACRQCRERKQRCIVEDKARGCTNCAKKGRECSARSTTVSAQHLASTNDPLKVLHDQSLCDGLVDLYFDLMHDKQHALFHRPSFIAQQRKNQAPSYLVLSMMALVARFSSDTRLQSIKPRERGHEWADQSRRSFNDREDTVSLAAAQGCALLANLAFAYGDSAMESLYGAQQIRIVQLLGLPTRLSSDNIQRETEIRVWWTTWMMDTWTSSSIGVPKQLIQRRDHIKPMEEESFHNLLSNAHEPPNTIDKPRAEGLWSYMIPLTELLAQVGDLNKNAATQSLSQDEVLDKVRDLGSRLNHWLFCLPEDLQPGADNLKTYRDRGLGRILVALYLGFHHHSLQLYFQFLSFNSAQVNHERVVAMYAERCKDHAVKLSELMWTANTTSGLECLWPINGHLLVVASAVHLHTLLNATDESSITKAKTLLEQNFELLLQLQNYWICLDWSMARLQTFHRACQHSAVSTFDFNHWMLHFLQKYALPIHEQESGPSPMVYPSLDGWSPSSIPMDATARDILGTFFCEL